MKFDIIHYPCSSCGAFMVFSPKLGTLACEYCGNEESLSVGNQKALYTYDYFSKITTYQEIDYGELTKELRCPKCGGEFNFETLQFAHHCPYCETPAIIDCIHDTKPQGLIPFAITRQEAKEHFEEWIVSRWFAPNSLSEHFNNTKELMGHYIPFWTFDAHTTTQYRGYRGEYIEQQRIHRSFDSDGNLIKKKIGTRQIRWHRVTGELQRSFEDLAISANQDGVEHIHVNAVAPWDTKRAVDFDTKYISGFEAKEYRQTLPNAYKSAQRSLESLIKWDIKRQIGGDDQRIEEYTIEYKEVQYKYLLFPLWVAQFDWKGKHYEYAINGLTGKVSGERPYSAIKIVFAIVVVMMIVGGVWYSMGQ